MSVRIYVKDNTDGKVHEYGTNPHDSLVLQEDGSLHYENLQSCTGTKYPEEGYSFCTVSGKPPEDTDGERIVDIGGDRTGVNCHRCKYRKRHQKCSCCRRNPNLKDNFALDPKAIDAARKAVLK